MRFRYGNFTHPTGEITSCRFEPATGTNARGRAQTRKYRLSVQGMVIAAGQSAIDARVAAIQDAYAIEGYDAAMLRSNGAPRYGVISGSYNVRQPDETFVREKTPQELALILLAAMGETNANVSALPNAARPSVDWHGDNPASELDTLCGALGCVIAIDSNGSNLTRICRVGQGSSLPAGPYLGGSLGIEAKPAPRTILALGGKIVFQAQFATEAVGLDTDGKWKLPTDLSYTPAVGWEREDPYDFPNLVEEDREYTDAGGRTLKCVELAKRTHLRAFRITGLVEGGWSPIVLQGTSYRPSKLEDLELLEERAEQIVGNDGIKRSAPTQYRANYWDEESGGNKSGYPILSRGASLDTKQGIVTTSDPLFFYETAANGLRYWPAQLRVETGFHAGRDGVMAAQGYTHDLNSDTHTGPHVIERPEIQRRVVQKYGNANQPSIASDTESQVNAELQHYAEREAEKFALTTSTTRCYEEIRNDIPIDGLTSQITWSGGGGRGGQTTVSVGRGHNPWIPSIADMHRKRKLDKIDAEKRPARK